MLFIDEVHRFSKTQQDALLAAVENRTVLLVAATTENPSFSVVAPLLSRSLGRVDRSKGAQAAWSRDRRRRYRPVGIDENAGRGDTVDLLYIDELRTQKDFTGVNSLEATTTVPDNGLIVTTSNAGVGHSVVLRDYRELAKQPIDEGTWRDTRMALLDLTPVR